MVIQLINCNFTERYIEKKDNDVKKRKRNIEICSRTTS